MAEKMTRKELLKQNDTFLSTSERVVLWAQENKKLAITIASCCVLAILLAVVGRMVYTSNQKAKHIAFQEASDLASVDGSRAKAIESFQAFLKQYSGSAQAPLAQLSLGRLYFNSGQYDKSVEYYEQALPKLDKTPEFVPLASLGCAAAYEAVGKVTEAISRLAAARENPSNYIMDETMLQLTRLYHKAGQNDKAKETGEQFVKQFPESANVEYVKYLAGMK